METRNKTALTTANPFTERLLDPGKAFEGNLHSGDCLSLLLFEVVEWEVARQVFVVSSRHFKLLINHFQLQEEWPKEVNLQRKVLFHEKSQLQVFGRYFLLSQYSWINVKNEVILVVKLVELRLILAVQISARLFNPKNSLSNEPLREIGPTKQSVFLKNLDHLSSSQEVCHCSFEEVLAILSLFVSGRQDFEARHSDFKVEALFDKSGPFESLGNAHSQRCAEVVITDDPGQSFVSVLTQRVVVYAQLQHSTLSAKTQALGEHPLQLLLGEEEEVHHFAHGEIYGSFIGD